MQPLFSQQQHICWGSSCTNRNKQNGSVSSDSFWHLWTLREGKVTDWIAVFASPSWSVCKMRLAQRPRLSQISTAEGRHIHKTMRNDHTRWLCWAVLRRYQQPFRVKRSRTSRDVSRLIDWMGLMWLNVIYLSVNTSLRSRDLVVLRLPFCSSCLDSVWVFLALLLVNLS